MPGSRLVFRICFLLFCSQIEKSIFLIIFYMSAMGKPKGSCINSAFAARVSGSAVSCEFQCASAVLAATVLFLYLLSTWCMKRKTFFPPSLIQCRGDTCFEDGIFGSREVLLGQGKPWWILNAVFIKVCPMICRSFKHSETAAASHKKRRRREGRGICSKNIWWCLCCTA